MESPRPDPPSDEAEWLVLDADNASSDLPFNLFRSLNVQGAGPYTNFAATSRHAFLLAISQSGTFPTLVDASSIASDLSPTRTVTYSGTTATLTDTGSARRQLRRSRARIAAERQDRRTDLLRELRRRRQRWLLSITDPENGATTFAYDGSNRIREITDPARRTTTLDYDGNGDLATITEPDGEALTFTYEGHRMTTKTARGLDTTRYTYASDGTLHTATKPAGEVTTMNPALTQGPQYSGSDPQYQGSYTDAHGVTHNIVIDRKGQIRRQYDNADGVAYTYTAGYYGDLDPAVGDQFARHNTLLRISEDVINGVPQHPTLTFDTYGRVTAKKAGNTIMSVTYDANGFVSDVAPQPSVIDHQITRDPAGHIMRILDHGEGRCPERAPD